MNLTQNRLHFHTPAPEGGEAPDPGITNNIWLAAEIMLDQEPWMISLNGRWIYQGGAGFGRVWNYSNGTYALGYNTSTQKWNVYEIANPSNVLLESSGVGQTDPVYNWPVSVIILFDGTAFARGLVVSGAGSPEVNGVYVLDSISEYQYMYKKVPWDYRVIVGFPGMGWSMGVYQGGSSYYTPDDDIGAAQWYTDYGGSDPAPTAGWQDS